MNQGTKRLLTAWKNDLIMNSKSWSDVPITYKHIIKNMLCHSIREGTLSFEQYKRITGEQYINDNKN